MPKIPSRKFGVIYADPPWPSCAGWAPNATYQSQNHYQTMSLEGLCKLPLEALVQDDAVLFLWVTNRDLPNAITKVIPAWGFEYKTVAFTWLKTTTTGKPVKVMGRWFFNSVEICLFATKGRPTRIHAGLNIKVDSFIVEQRIRHSQKPEEVKRRIEKMFPGCNKLELFARTQSPGWSVWGNEVESDGDVARILTAKG